MSTQKWKDEHQEEMRTYRRTYYKKNRKKEILRAKERRLRRIDWWKEYKSKFKCKYCPESDRRCLEFHHRNKKTKKYNISEMIHNGITRQKIIEEIKKCEIICSNCHKKRTFS